MATNFPMTQGIRFLKAKKAIYEPHFYEYQEKGGTKQSAEELGVPEHAVIKTIVLEDENGKGCICLMHGDREVSTKELARHRGVKTLRQATQEQSLKWTGYMFGGTGPFGIKAALDIYIESTLLDLDKVYINGGKRGFILEMSPAEIVRTINPEPVTVGI